jgi:hypothetical protein
MQELFDDAAESESSKESVNSESDADEENSDFPWEGIPAAAQVCSRSKLVKVADVFDFLRNRPTGDRLVGIFSRRMFAVFLREWCADAYRWDRHKLLLLWNSEGAADGPNGEKKEECRRKQLPDEWLRGKEKEIWSHHHGHGKHGKPKTLFDFSQIEKECFECFAGREGVLSQIDKDQPNANESGSPFSDESNNRVNVTQERQVEVEDAGAVRTCIDRMHGVTDIQYVLPERFKGVRGSSESQHYLQLRHRAFTVMLKLVWLAPKWAFISLGTCAGIV